jgi:hypothetical protein
MSSMSKASMVTNHLCQRVRLIFGPILFWHFCFLRYSRCLLNILTVQGGNPMTARSDELHDRA